MTPEELLKRIEDLEASLGYIPGGANFRLTSPQSNNPGHTHDASSISGLDAGDITTGTLPLARGGTNKSMTASNGAVVYSDADSLELSAVGSSGQVLTSGGAGAPTWSALGRVSAIKLDWANANLAGGQAETTLKTYTLPGGTLGTNDGLRIVFNYTGATDSILKFYWGGTAYITDTTVVTSPTTRTLVEIWNRNSASAQRLSSFGITLASTPAFVATTGADSGPSVNTASDVIIKITGETGGGGAMDLLGWTIEHIRA